MPAPFILHADDVPETEGRYPPPFDHEGLSFGRDLGRTAGSRTLGAWQERLPPGRRTSFPHAHLLEEELVYVLSGAPLLQWARPGEPMQDELLRPGSVVSFPAGTGIIHTFSNPGPTDAVLLVVGERRAGDQVGYLDQPALDAWRRLHRPHRVWAALGDIDPAAKPPAWKILTPRLNLRPWEPMDAPALNAMIARNQQHLLPWMPWAEKLLSTDEQAEQLLRFRESYGQQKDYVLGFFVETFPIGGCGLHPRIGGKGLEIGYWIDKAHEGQGYVTELSAALTKLALTVYDCERVEIHCTPSNVRSSAVPQRLGFAHEVTLPRRFLQADGWVDTMIWTMFRGQLSDAVANAPVQAWDVLGRRLI